MHRRVFGSVNLSSRTQIISIDSLLGFFLFVIVLGLLYSQLQSFDVQSQQTFRTQQLVDSLSHATELVLFSPGYPVSWFTDSVQIVGLSSPTYGILDTQKVSSLLQLNSTGNYSAVKQSLGLSPYTVYISFFALNGSNRTFLYGWGVKPQGYPTATPIVLERIVFLNNSLCVVRFEGGVI
jgi:hypothetical protein